MRWKFNKKCFLILLLTGIMSSTSGKNLKNVNKSHLPERKVDFNKENCDGKKSVTEFRLLLEANKFKPTNKELVIIIGCNGADAVDLAKFLTNGNQTIHNKSSGLYEYDSNKRHAQQHLFEYYDNKAKTAYYAHRGEFLEDDYLVNRFLTKKVIDYAEKVKIILTYKITDGMEKIFQLAHRIVPNLLKYKQHILLVSTTGKKFDGKSYLNEKEVFNELKKMSTMATSTGKIAQSLLDHKLFAGISSFSENAKELIKTAVKDLPFATSNKTDFVYPNSTNSIQGLVAACIYYNNPSSLYMSVDKMLGDMKNHLKNFEKENCIKTNVPEVRHCAKTLEKFYTYILSTYNEIKNLKTPHNFFNKIREIVQHLNFSLSETTLIYLKQQESVYNYIFEIAQPAYQDTEVLSSSLSLFLNTNLKFHKFYESFLEITDINVFSSSMNEQKRKNIDDLFNQIEESPLILDKNTFHAKAFEVVKQTIYNKNVSWECIPIEDKKYDYKMEVRGEIVSLNYVNSKQCENLTYIEIFALNSVIIDENLNLEDRKMQVGIVAPTWVIIGNRIVNLNGTDGRKWDSAAENGKTSGVRLGAHGKPGRPGESAGHFYGIAENIINSEKLQVHANGGNGGAGQIGGNGVKGENGKTYTFDKFYRSGEKPGWTRSKRFKYNDSVYNPKTITIELIFGKPGQSGGRGGHGGVGGLGGFSGDITVLQLRKNPHNMPKVNRRNLPGNMGRKGNGGKGAPGGENGYDLEIECSTSYGSSFKSPEECKLICEIEKGDSIAGADGKNGGYFIGRKEARQVEKVQSFARIVNNYKNYAREMFDRSMRNVKLDSFYTLLNNHEEIVESYSVLDFIEEFIDLEKQFATLANISVLFPSYDNFLSRVKKLNDEMKNKNIRDEYKTIPISSMLIDLKAKVDIIKMQGFNKAEFSIASEFQKLDSIYKKNLIKSITAEKFTSIFKTLINDIDDSIEEGRQILKTVQSIIDDVESELNQDLESVVQELITARRNQSTAINKLDKEFKNIEDGIQKKILIGIGKSIFQSLAVINPVMGCVGIAGTSVLNIVEDSINNKGKYSKAVTLTTSITKALSTDFKAAEDLVARRKQAVEESIKKKESVINEALKTLPANDDNAKILRKWKSLNDLNSVRSQPLSSSFKTPETKVETEKALLENEKDNKVKKYDVAKEVIEKFEATNQVVKIFGEVGKAVEEDEALLNRLTTSIKDANKNLDKLRRLEDNIYNSIVPILDGIKEQFDVKNNEFSKISKIRLSLVHWKISQQLQTAKNSMESMLKNFKANDAFIWTMQKLISAVDLLLHVQKQISEIEEEKKKQHSTLSLSMNSLQKIPQSWYVGDVRVSRSFAILNKYYQINFFKRVYGDWLQVYKQFVFPYSDKLVDLPTVSVAVSDLNILEKGLENVEILLTDYKDNKFPPEKSTMNFVDASTGTTEPFYTWSHEQYKTEVDKLLSGIPVTFFANITNKKLNAVKFNSIKIIFHGENEAKIREDFKYFTISLKHEGDSYYKCNNSTFLIRTSPTIMDYGLDERANFKGGDLQRLTDQDFVLSPYATWTIQLLQAHTKRKKFSFLNKYKGKIDLGLEGRGFFIKQDTDKCQHDELFRFYHLVKEAHQN